MKTNRKRHIPWPLVSALAVFLMIVVLLLTGAGVLPHRLVSDAKDLITAGTHLVSTGEKKSSVPVHMREYSLEELQEDFTRVRAVVEKKHSMLFANRESVQRTFDRQYSLLEEGMGELEFYRVLSPAIAALECGHSNVLLSGDYEGHVKEEAGLFPAHLRVFGTRLLVTETRRPGALPAGAEIVSINGLSSREILAELYESISSDGGNKTRTAEVVAHQFPFLFYTLIDNADSFTVRFRAPGNDIEAVKDIESEVNFRAPGGAASETGGSAKGRPTNVQVSAVEGAGFSELWSSGSRIYSINILLDGGELKRDYSARLFDEYALLSVGSFILDNDAFAAFLEEFFAEVERREIDSLILDLRGNWGGTPKPAALLLSYLSEEPVRYLDGDAPFYMFAYKRARPPKEQAFDGTTYLLTDGACFSTTSHLVSILKYHGLATLIGGETGGSAACSDGKRRLILPNTGLRVYYSTTVFKTDVSGFPTGTGISPDFEVLPRPEDLTAGRDPLITFAGSLAEK